MLPELQDSLLEHGYLPGRPVLKHHFGGDWINQDVKVPFFIEVVDGIKILFNRLFLFLLIGLVNFVLKGHNLKYRVFFLTNSS